MSAKGIKLKAVYVFGLTNYGIVHWTELKEDEVIGHGNPQTVTIFSVGTSEKPVPLIVRVEPPA